VANETSAAIISSGLYPEIRVRSGSDAAARLVREVEADIVLNAIVGFAGLEPTLASLEHGRTLALANKESLVCAGSLVSSLAARHDVQIIPVDSEHSALFQLIGAAGSKRVQRLVVTASGGPFRGRTAADLATVTPAEALAHPTWSMGKKISIDSATLMNKGLEVIEAHHLFGAAYGDIEVVLHPQSLVHALVRLSDGALLAHLGSPDMRVPIAFALHYPEARPVDAQSLDFSKGLSLEFAAPDELTFPAIRLARTAGERGDLATCALNAANEEAVGAFLEGRLAFLRIFEIVESVLEGSSSGTVGTYEEAVAVDRSARAAAREMIAI